MTLAGKIDIGVSIMIDWWRDFLNPPLTGRSQKPRETGITMLLDKGLTVSELDNLLELCHPYLDFIKLSFGTTALYPLEILQAKLDSAKKSNVQLYSGGTFFELAAAQNKTKLYFERLLTLGFEWVEISDGTIELPLDKRLNSIKLAQETGLKVLTEVGKKNPKLSLSESEMIELALTDFDAGASMVIIEARESGQGIGIYDEKGNVCQTKLATLQANLPINKVIWEAPQKSQQAILINHFGSEVNLGNIPPSETLALEALRLGLRSDTWKDE